MRKNFAQIAMNICSSHSYNRQTKMCAVRCDGWHGKFSSTSINHCGPNQVNRAGVACACHFPRANLLKRDLDKLSNCEDEPQVVFHAAPFLEERLPVQVE
jgi:hypothetical protein